MKILFLSSSLAPQFGGAAVSESTLCGKLSSEHEVVVLSRKNRLDLAFTAKQGIKKVVSFKPSEVVKAFFDSEHYLCQLIQKAEVFHLNGHWFWENYFFARLCTRYDIPYILHPRGMLWVSYRRPLLKRVFNLVLGNWIVSHASKIILLSEFERTQLANYSIKEENLIVIPNGVEIAELESSSSKPDESYLLYLGRIEERKNLKFLIRSFEKAYQKNRALKLRLVGPFERGYEQILIKLIRELNLGEVVRVEGPLYGKDKEELLKGAQAVIYPAQGEPFGRTVFEAFAAGTLCLTPLQSGGAEYVRKFAPELLYPDHSEDMLAKKILNVGKMALDHRRRLIFEARSWVEQNLDWSLISKKILDSYEFALKEAKRGHEKS